MAKRIYACPKCGLQVGVNDNVCTNCGTSLENKVIIENGKIVTSNNQVNSGSAIKFSNEPTFSLTHHLILEESSLLIKKADLYARSNIINLNIEFMNLSNKNIRAIKMIIYCLDTAMRELEEIEYNYLDLNEEKYNTFGYNKSISIKNKQTRAFDLKVSEIIFDDLSIYNCDIRVSQWNQISDDDLNQVETDILYLKTLRQYDQCQNVRNYKNVIDTLKSIEDYKDSKNIIEECYIKIHDKAYENQKDTIEGLEQTIHILNEIGDWNNVNQEIEDCEKEIIYLMAEKLVDSKDKDNQVKKDKYKKAITLYEQIIDWKDSVEEIERCKEEIQKCDELMKQSNKKRKKYIIIAVCSLCLVILGYLVIDKLITSMKYNETISLLEEGEYAEAIAKFKELGDYKNSKEMIEKANKKLQDKILGVYEIKYESTFPKEIKDLKYKLFLNSANELDVKCGGYTNKIFVESNNQCYVDFIRDNTMRFYYRGDMIGNMTVNYIFTLNFKDMSISISSNATSEIHEGKLYKIE